MNKIKRIGMVAVLTLALSLSISSHAMAGLTLGATSVASGGVLTLTSVGADLTLTAGTAASKAVVITGVASGTDALKITAGDVLLTSGHATLTAGNATLTDGNLVMSEGIATINSTGDETSYVKRNHATSTAAVVEVEQTHAGATGSALLLDQNATGNAIGLEITHDGDLAAINVVASVARTGNVINIPMANQLAQTALDITGAATGTSSEGIIHVDVTGVLAGNAIRIDSTGANAATGQLIYATSAGKQAGATNGIAGYFTDTGAATATSYTVYIASTSNEALHVDTGLVVFDETLTMTGGADVVLSEGKLTVDSTVDETSYVKRNQATVTGPVVEIEDTATGSTQTALLIDQNGTGNSTALQISHDGDYPVIDIDAGAARTGNVIDIAMADQLAQTALDITGAATGTASEGIIHVDVTGVLAGNAIRIDSTGANAATGQLIYAKSTGAQAGATNGIVAYFEDTGAAAATSYAVYIASTSNEALHVDTGNVVFDENLTVTGTLTQTGAATLASTLTVNGAQIIGDGATEIVGTKQDVVDGGATNPFTVTIAMAGTVFYNSQAIEFDLPEASTCIGCSYTFVVANASNLDVDPDGADIILNAANAVGDKIRSATVGDTVTVVAIDATNWVVQGMYPANTDWVDTD